MLRSESKALCSNLGSFTTSMDFTQGMVNALNEDGPNLTPAALNQEGANLLMLQVRQNLSTTALSLSTQQTQSTRRYF